MSLSLMLRAPKHLRAYIRYRQRAIEDRVAHRARAILLLTIMAALVLFFALLTALRHVGL
jgi:hypothetical protein